MSDSSKRDFLHQVVDQAKAPVGEARELLKKDGHLRGSQTGVSTVIALSLGFLCLLGVLAFHYPQYLTTPELRARS